TDEQDHRSNTNIQTEVDHQIQELRDEQENISQKQQNETFLQ
ncbi:unnamed protein product, partial [Didymodactylos carnosus]